MNAFARLLSGCLLSTLAVGGAAFAQERSQQPAEAEAVAATSIQDGPYLSYGASQVQAQWVCDGEVIRKTFKARRWPLRIPPRCGYPDPIEVRAKAVAKPTSAISGVDRIVALSDIHGQFDLAVRLLQANRVIDKRLRWNYGSGHLVVVGDVFDRGARVTETFWLLYQLQQQARDAGGDVHVLLGNHETMVLYDDLRYVNPKYLRGAELLGKPYPQLYDADSVLGAWLRTLPTMLKIDDLLFVHGGIEPGHFDLQLDRDAVNARYRQSLGLAKTTVKQDPLFAPLYDGKTSPIWYRGYFKQGELSQNDMQTILDRLGVSRIVVGHTSMEHVGGYFDGRVIAVDSSIKEGRSGELLFVENGRLERGMLDGKRVPL
ncbi:metallophosphoesterase [Lysobacter sp. Root690]|uniref:metallophosphoesterase n=1 Tax=Lysobacter sp. Root690 TaxID=1736588 RepID=UPI0006F79A91|nr:metallophosphoesterase [Lysobacter sp. Root690]KRB11631.1 metallophosphoesterase [Lysobacter sp. Root690]